MSYEPLIIAIDGPSGVGKSTVAMAVAARLELPYLETGAMYRALGWSLQEREIDPADRKAVARMAESLELELEERPNGSVDVLLSGRPLDPGVRTPEVSEITSVVSSFRGVRSRMVTLQRQFARLRGAVVEGRDIGTRVFPDTPYKFFLTAPLAVRVARRVKQLKAAGERNLSAAAMEAEIADRDQRDSEREESPLSLDGSYTVVDTGDLSIEEAVSRILDEIARANRSPAGDCL